MAGGRLWTKADCRKVVAILRRHTTAISAINDIRRKLKRSCSINSVGNTLATHGFDSPSTYLRIPDPVIEHRERDTKRAERGLVADLVARLRKAEARQSVLDTFSGFKVPQIPRHVFTGKTRQGCPVILASDWHVEETVRADSTPLGNVFNLRVADVRIGRFFSGIEWLRDFHRPVFGIEEMVLWLGGDFITGYLRDENLETNTLSPTKAMQWVYSRLIRGIERLAEDKPLKRLIIPCSYGNHGRTTDKIRRSTGAQNSYEWLMYQMIAQHFAGHSKIEIVCDESAHQYVKVYGRTLHFHHGDEVRFAGGIGGLTVPMRKAVVGWDEVKFSDIHHTGHFHQMLDMSNWVGNGSLIGFNAYAMSIRANPEDPKQAFYMLDSERGKTCVCPIWVRE